MLSLPTWNSARFTRDWLVDSVPQKAAVYQSGPTEIVLANGLIARRFRVAPNAATVGFENLTTRETLLRAVEPEATVTVDGKKWNIGGLGPQPDRAYLDPKWLDGMKALPESFSFDRFEVGPTRADFPWKKVRPSENRSWPPAGTALTLHFKSPAGMEAEVRYELLDGLPVLGKQLTIINRGSHSVRIDRFESERLAAVEPESFVESSPTWRRPPISVFTDYSFGGLMGEGPSGAVHWLDDPAYTTQVNYRLLTPCLLSVSPAIGPGVDLAQGQSWQSFKTYELVQDSTDRERQGLAIRRMMRTLAPWVTENPLMMHLTSTNVETVKRAVDQCADVGFEMIILSFGSGVNMEDPSPDNVAKFKAMADYARSKGIELGGYSLLASRHIDDKNDVINPKTGKPGGAIFGDSPCLGSEWGQEYFGHVKSFLEKTGFSLLEHDGSYPGDVCASTSHPGHHGLEDSQWTQWRTINDFYGWCRERGIFLNVPDTYFFNGSNKTAMGYRETNWSLPRAQQHIHARQNLFDGTWEKPPTMGWMFVPLVEYQGGGAAATIEPLSEHLADYERHLQNNLGFGAQACYRGPRLYDTPQTRHMVAKWVSWFKKHRRILESDVIHVRRADGVHLDAILHVNPSLATKGMLVVYNPSDQVQEEELAVPLYYTGLREHCAVSHEDGPALKMALDRQERLVLRVSVPAGGCTWFTMR